MDVQLPPTHTYFEKLPMGAVFRSLTDGRVWMKTNTADGPGHVNMANGVHLPGPVDGPLQRIRGTFVGDPL